MKHSFLSNLGQNTEKEQLSAAVGPAKKLFQSHQEIFTIRQGNLCSQANKSLQSGKEIFTAKRARDRRGS
jgi:hypothetical protein